MTGSFGSKVSMLYPMSILNGDGAKTEYTGITFAGKGQNLDIGFKAILNASNTSAVINSKSISKDGGECTYRSLIRITENAIDSTCRASFYFYNTREDVNKLILVLNKAYEMFKEYICK